MHPLSKRKRRKNLFRPKMPDSFSYDLNVTRRSKKRNDEIKKKAASKIQRAIRRSLSRKRSKASAKRRKSHTSRVAR